MEGLGVGRRSVQAEPAWHVIGGSPSKNTSVEIVAALQPEMAAAAVNKLGVCKADALCTAALQEITLSEALTGTTFYVTHLDGRSLEVKTEPGEAFPAPA